MLSLCVCFFIFCCCFVFLTSLSHCFVVACAVFLFQDYSCKCVPLAAELCTMSVCCYECCYISVSVSSCFFIILINLISLLGGREGVSLAYLLYLQSFISAGFFYFLHSIAYLWHWLWGLSRELLNYSESALALELLANTKLELEASAFTGKITLFSFLFIGC